MDRGKSILKAIGPGFLFAATSVGVSHLVQCTRAGAGFGLSLLPVAVLVLILKYPLFEFGQRYAAATGTSLLEGYRRQGRWTLVLYLLLTLGTMFTVVAAVTYVTAGLAIQLSGLDWSALQWSVILMVASGGILVVGRYPLLDKAIKVIMAVLTLSTAAATLAVLPRLTAAQLFGPIALADVGFIVAFVGWMPTGMDVTVWQSFWALARGGRRDTLLRCARRSSTSGWAILRPAAWPPCSSCSEPYSCSTGTSSSPTRRTPSPDRSSNCTRRAWGIGAGR